MKLLDKAVLAMMLFLVATTVAVHDIRDFGAMSEDDSLIAEQTNQQALIDAIVQANFTATDREVLVPANCTFHMLPVRAMGIRNLTIIIDGTIKVSKRHHRYSSDENMIQNFFEFYEVHDFTIKGSGTVDGQGYMWWIRDYLGRNPTGRPNLIELVGGTNLEFTGVRWINAPFYHMHILDFDGAYFHDFEIYVDAYGQLELDKLFLGDHDSSFINGIGGKTLPTYALNTDGIDPAGKNVLIERVNITNYDDAVAVKPMSRNGTYAQCSENIIVRDCNVWFGVGMTIGSVSPNNAYNCIQNVQFLNHKMYHPFKAIYVKNNPGVTDSMEPGSGGIISNIVYDNIEIHRPIWWAIYIGPQQQHQPGQHGGDAGPGCLFYPLTPCETNNLVDIRDITLNNIQMYDAVLPPGVIRCNETLPCTNIVFQNVKASGWWSVFRLNYFTENVHGAVVDSTPAPKFITSEGDGFVGDDWQFVFVQDTVEYIRDLIFGQKVSSYRDFVVKGQVFPNYGQGYQRFAKNFADFYLRFAQI